MAAPTATPLATPTGQSSSKSHHGAVLLIAGCTGGMGSILLNHITSSTVYKGRPIALLIALDYFPDTSGPATLNSSLREHCRFETLVMHWDAARISSTTEVAHRIDQATDIIDAALITTGLGFHGNLGDLSLEESDKTLQRLMQVNAIGPSLLSQYCAQKMQAAATSGITTEAPILLVLSSYSGVVGLAHRAAYCSSKFALNGFLESLHAEYPELRLVLVCPTSVSTAFRANWKKDLAAQGVNTKAIEVNKADLTAEECVSAVWSAFISPSSTGGISYRILPDGLTAASYWLLRLPFIGDYLVRPRVLSKSSKL